MSNYREQIKERLLLFYRKNKISQSKFSADVGVRRQTIGSWLSFDNDTLPSFEAVKWLKDNYGLKTDWLIRGEE